MKKYTGLIVFAVIIVILIIVALMPTDEDKYLNEITFAELTTKIDKKEDFILKTRPSTCGIYFSFMFYWCL